MHLIIEGPTASGKSTLMKAVADKVGEHEHVHMVQPAELTRRWALNEYVNRWQKPLTGHLQAAGADK